MALYTLKGCTATAFIGGLNFFKVSRGTVSGANVTISTSTINKDEATSTSAREIATVALNSNYENLVVTVTMGGTTVNWYANGKVTIPANTTVTGDIKISASATAINTGGGSGTVDSEEPGTSGGSGNTPSAGTLFDFDFVNNTIDKYVSDGIITIPSTSKTDTLTYDSKGMTTTSTGLPAALNNGVKLTNPFDLASQSWAFEVTMTMDVYDAESMGTSVTEVLYPNMVFFSATEHDTLEDGKAHGSNCLAPAIYISSGGFSGRLGDNGGITVNKPNTFVADGLEHTYRWEYDSITHKSKVYKDGVNLGELNWSSTTSLPGGQFGYMLGVHSGYSSAKNFNIKIGYFIKSIKFYKA